MTVSIAINPVQNRYQAGHSGVSVVPPAEVWDVDSGASRRVGTPSVRTLNSLNRMHERTPRSGSGAEGSKGEVFESRHETRDTVILGVSMTAALLIGSAFGGVFSGGESSAAAPSGEVARTAAVAAR